MPYVVYIGSSSYFFSFSVNSCFSENSRLILVLLFFLNLVCIVTTTFHKFELQCQKRLSQNQRNISDTFEIQTLCSSHQGRWLDKILVHVRTGHRQQMGLSLQDFQTLPQKVGTEICCLTCSTRNVCKSVSSRPTGFLSRFCSNDFPLFNAALFTQLFFQGFLSHTLYRRLERFSTTKNFSNLWCSKLQHVNTFAFCRWDDLFTQKWNCNSPNNLC